MSITVNESEQTHDRYQPRSPQGDLYGHVAMNAAVTNRFEATQDQP